LKFKGIDEYEDQIQEVEVEDEVALAAQLLLQHAILLKR